MAVWCSWTYEPRGRRYTVRLGLHSNDPSVPPYRALLDCDTKDPANAFVSALYFSLRSTEEAIASISLPV